MTEKTFLIIDADEDMSVHESEVDSLALIAEFSNHSPDVHQMVINFASVANVGDRVFTPRQYFLIIRIK